jgi:hypothetical protein
MKKGILLCGTLCCLIGLSVVIGCGLQKSNKTYTVTVSGLSASLQTVSYEVSTVNNTSATGYSILGSGTAPTLTLTARNFYSTDSRFVTPQITFNRVHVDYSIVTDSGSILGAWKPTAVDNAANIIISRGIPSITASGETSASGEAGVTTTVVLNDLTAFPHLAEVANKIINVSVSGPVLGIYSFSISLKTNLVVRATVTLSGEDEYGNGVSTDFTTDIQYVI